MMMMMMMFARRLVRVEGTFIGCVVQVVDGKRRALTEGRPMCRIGTMLRRCGFLPTHCGHLAAAWCSG